MYNISTEESKRIDIIKFISIIFIVFTHTSIDGITTGGQRMEFALSLGARVVTYTISGVMTGFAVPCFFVISAMLMYRKEQDYLSMLKNKFRTLFIPYVIWNTIMVLFYEALHIFRSILQSSYTGDGYRSIMTFGLKDWLHVYGIGSSPSNSPLWFIRDLMIVTLFYPIINAIVKKAPRTMLAIALILYIASPFDFLFMEVILLTIVGACIVNIGLRMELVDRIPFLPLTALTILCVGISVYLGLNDCSVYGLRKTTILIMIIYATRLSGYIYKNIKLQNIFVWLAESEFVIYALHIIVLAMLMGISVKILPQTSLWLTVLYLSVPFVTIVICIAVKMFLKRFMNGIYRVMTGSR